MTREPGARRWLAAALAVAALYVIAGLAFGIRADAAADDQMRVAWRLAAFGVSAAAFAAHLAWEHFRLRNSPPLASLHVSAAVALGAFALAAAVNIHPPRAPGHRLLLALLLWPIVTALPAFLTASALTTLATAIERGQRSA